MTEIDEAHHVIIATPEKALCDVIVYGSRSVKFSNAKQAEEYLIEDLRVDEEDMNRIKAHNLRKIHDRYRSKSIKYLIQYIESKRN